jgi:hypothetical protein
MAGIVQDAPIPLFYVLFLVLLAAFVVFSLAVVAAGSRSQVSQATIWHRAR